MRFRQVLVAVCAAAMFVSVLLFAFASRLFIQAVILFAVLL